jgi:hypothetical protein
MNIDEIYVSMYQSFLTYSAINTLQFYVSW